MKPVEFLKEDNFKLKSVYQLLRTKKRWVSLYKKYFNTDCMIAFLKTIQMLKFHSGELGSYGGIFMIKGKRTIYAICIAKDTIDINWRKEGEMEMVDLLTAVKLLEGNKDSKIVDKEEYLKVKKLAILESLK